MPVKINMHIHFNSLTNPQWTTPGCCQMGNTLFEFQAVHALEGNLGVYRNWACTVDREFFFRQLINFRRYPMTMKI